MISAQTRRFAKWSAICSFTLGMAGQVAYHLMAQAGMVRAPWPVTTVVSCLPVLVLGMGTALAHMLRADAAADGPDSKDTGPATAWSSDQSVPGQGGPDQGGPDQDQRLDRGTARTDTRRFPLRQSGTDARTTAPEPRDARPQAGQAHLIARRLAAAGKPVSRRALRDAGVKGSNESLNTLARKFNAELATGRTSLP